MPDRERPDPDALLRQAQARDRSVGRGRLKVYLGMAAGVGKTYSMLSDAQQIRERGVDVVVGYLEPHGRLETERLADGLERIPLLELAYGGVVLREFDLDAALARRPQLLLLDELAHTNAPGARHRKRWQDAEELLQAGIDVYATVNIQHLESLNEVVAQITGVVVSETLPDSIVTEATEIELVDLPPDELIQRIRDGKVYVSEKIEQALSGFFKRKNLAALREIALRRTAESVESQVQSYRAVEGAKGPWRTSERILVCVAPNRMATRVVRAAKRMANALHGDFLAVTIERAAEAGDPRRQLADEGLRLAENLGADTTVLSSDSVAQTLLDFARARNVTTIVVGKSSRPRWREVVFGSVVDTLVRTSRDIDIHVITEAGDAEYPRILHRSAVSTDWLGWGVATMTIAFATVVCAILDRFLSDAGKVSMYLLGVVVVGAKRSRSAAFLASLLSVAAFNFFFTEPRYSLTVHDAQYWFVFAVFLIVGLTISVLTGRLRVQTQSASDRAKRTDALYELSRKLSGTRSRTELGYFAAEQVRSVFGCEVAVLIRSRRTGELFAAPASRTGFENADRERGVAAWVLDRGKRAGNGTDTLPSASGLYLPLNGERGCVGVMAVSWGAETPMDLGNLHLLETFANQLAVAVERTNLAKDSHEASLVAEREKLRNTLLSSVSHDLRTPLAVISGAAEQLRASPTITNPQDRELAESLAEGALRLERQVRNLLDMTRIESGALELRCEWHSLEELVGSALRSTEALLAGRSVHVRLAPDLPLLWLDGVLMERVFVNLMENASRHTPATATVWLDADVDAQRVRIEFANDGPSPAPSELQSIFEKFGRGVRRKGEGSGLGLAICRAIVQAHDGTITAEPRQPQGVRFVISLPKPLRVPEVPND